MCSRTLQEVRHTREKCDNNKYERVSECIELQNLGMDIDAPTAAAAAAAVAAVAAATSEDISGEDPTKRKMTQAEIGERIIMGTTTPR